MIAQATEDLLMAGPVEHQEKTATKFCFGLFEADSESENCANPAVRIRLQAQPPRLILSAGAAPAK